LLIPAAQHCGAVDLGMTKPTVTWLLTAAYRRLQQLAENANTQHLCGRAAAGIIALGGFRITVSSLTRKHICYLHIIAHLQHLFKKCHSLSGNSSRQRAARALSPGGCAIRRCGKGAVRGVSSWTVASFATHADAPLPRALHILPQASAWAGCVG